MSCCRPCFPLRGRLRFSKNDSPVSLQDLLSHPSKIDERLNVIISEWQVAILDYENLELSFLEDCEGNGGPHSPVAAEEILREMKSSPKAFLKNSNWIKTSPLLHDLTNLYVKVLDLQSKLPVQAEKFENSVPPIAVSSLPQEDLHAGDPDSYLRRLSATWSQRLNDIDDTQGACLQLQRPTSFSSSVSSLQPSIPGPPQESPGGTIQCPKSPLSPTPFRLRPRWPRYLTDVCYDVVKVNKLGQHMRRTLKLTQHHILSIKDSGACLTKFYPYRDIRRAFITPQQTRLQIVQRGGKINTYISPVALHLFQQIVTRVKIRRALDTITFHDSLHVQAFLSSTSPSKKGARPLIQNNPQNSTSEGDGTNFSDTNLTHSTTTSSKAQDDQEMFYGHDTLNDGEQMMLQFTPQSTAVIISAISDANNTSADAVLAAFAKDLKDRTLLNMQQNQDSSSSSQRQSRVIEDSDPMVEVNDVNEDETYNLDSPKVIDPNNQIGSGGSAVYANNSNSSTSHTNGSVPEAASVSAEGAVQRRVRDLLCDKNTPEGATLSHFLTHTVQRIHQCLHRLQQQHKEQPPPQQQQSTGTGQSMSRQGSFSTSLQRSASESMLLSETIMFKETLLKIRHFIDGLHEYCLEHRGFALATFYQQNLQKQLTSPNNNASSARTIGSNNKVGDGAISSQKAQQQQQQQYMNQHVALVQGVTETAQLHSRESIRFLQEHRLDLKQVDADTLTRLSLVIFLAVEETVFLSLRTNLVKLYHQVMVFNDHSNISSGSNRRSAKNSAEPSNEAPLDSAIVQTVNNNSNNNNNSSSSSSSVNRQQHSAKWQEMRLQKALRLFRSRSQSDWGIPLKLQSPLGWKSAIFELSSLEHNLTPSVQLQVLTRTIKSIYHEFQYAILPRLIQQQKSNESAPCIAADELVPIFLYVFCQVHSGALRNCLQNRDFMWGLGHPDQLRGETGYYLTVYESAIECVLQEEAEQQLQQQLQTQGLQRSHSNSSIGSRSRTSSSSSRSFSFDENSGSLRRSSGSVNSTGGGQNNASVRKSVTNFFRFISFSPSSGGGNMHQPQQHNQQLFSGVSEASAHAPELLEESYSSLHEHSSNEQQLEHELGLAVGDEKHRAVDNPLLRALRMGSDDSSLIRESFA